MSEITEEEREFVADLARRLSEIASIPVAFSVQPSGSAILGSFHVSIERRNIPPKDGAKTGSLEPSIDIERMFGASS